MAKFQSVDELVEATRPVNPVYCIREDSIETSAAWFKNNFPGNILYAVKANPNEKVLKTLLKTYDDKMQTDLHLKLPPLGRSK